MNKPIKFNELKDFLEVNLRWNSKLKIFTSKLSIFNYNKLIPFY